MSHNIIFYSSKEGKINVQFFVDSKNDTIRTTQKAMSEIFGVDVSGGNMLRKKIQK